jgi:Putative auto-transporter adhesin, head GIN domain
MRSIVPLFAAAFAISAPVLAAEVVPVGQFRSVELHGGGVISVVPGPGQQVTIVEGSSQFTRMYLEADGKLRIDTCNDRCPNLYRLRIEIRSPRVPDLAVDGGGQIVTQGGFSPQSRRAAAVNGGGKIDVRSVDAQNVSAAVNGGGELLVHARSMLSAAVNGGGVVHYWGNPTATTVVHGGGAVRPGS